MTLTRTAPILVIGLGCRRGSSCNDLLALITSSLTSAGLVLSDVRALASLDIKQNEPGLIQLAAHLSLPLAVFRADQLMAYEPRLSHRSAIAFEHSGCWGVAESAALAMAEQLGNEPARLLITRQKSSVATFALACGGLVTR
ncbi:cobalamin biosynthesis protein [Pseudomonas psychrophila]|uniref:cobalamin biosynthesis protein n=1 Tax=Pseudomonas psychrophila TaxID=122355 RepID=UPI0002FC93C5|nr:cobalamin biosynthesis protein [Pseudomonas psychrophila]